MSYFPFVLKGLIYSTKSLIHNGMFDNNSLHIDFYAIHF
jgi:hypothetical protein